MDLLQITASWLLDQCAARMIRNCLCSRIATGYMKPEELDKFVDDNGTTFKEAASAAGYVAASSRASIINP